MQEQEALLMEVRKLIDILSTWGNILAPTIPGEEKTFARDKLKYVIKRLADKYNITFED